MPSELTYVLITPYSLLKSRTGGVIGRLLSQTRDLEFTGARMYAPGDAFLERFEPTLDLERMTEFAREALRQYVRESLPSSNRFGISNRAVVLLFRGEDAIGVLQKVIGDISRHVSGNTIRGTYGDAVTRRSGEMEFFEPAVLAPTTPEANRAQLRILHDFAMTDGGVLENLVRFPQGVAPQTTLVIIKPDNFMRQSARPGNIIDMFSRTGLFLVGAKLMHLSTEEAAEFYRPLRSGFVTRLVPSLAARLREGLQPSFDFPITDEQYTQIAEALADANAEYEFRRIVNYMTGVEEDPWARGKGESARCLALLYRGENAIEKIRERLGATNPDKAEPGTVRSTYGHDLMKNGAHASDSPENAERERRIIGLWKEGDTCEFQQLIRQYLEQA